MTSIQATTSRHRARHFVPDICLPRNITEKIAVVKIFNLENINQVIIVELNKIFFLEEEEVVVVVVVLYDSK